MKFVAGGERRHACREVTYSTQIISARWAQQQTQHLLDGTFEQGCNVHDFPASAAGRAASRSTPRSVLGRRQQTAPAEGVQRGWAYRRGAQRDWGSRRSARAWGHDKGLEARHPLADLRPIPILSPNL